MEIKLTPEELRDLVMARIERSLHDVGITLSAISRERILESLSLPEAVASSPRASANHAPSTRAVERLQKRASGSSSDNRTRVYRATSKAKEITDPQSTRDRVLNAILQNEVCTLTDLEKNTKRPTKAIYTALWQLKKNGLIDVSPLSLLLDHS